jgi:hypothetical protein
VVGVGPRTRWGPLPGDQQGIGIWHFSLQSCTNNKSPQILADFAEINGYNFMSASILVFLRGQEEIKFGLGVLLLQSRYSTT